ncbi:glycoside hydrolase family 2 protein [Enterococcus gallinarum]|uniref:glycoside hydrolase family 2 protein n=1 Tax=Enterococcus gallinarum TaxID=1353 RepID=UPI001D115ECE|nr:sugar-binding domain-containing protein [Enterococcus gallinarum]MCC2752600.1 glycoside hydrolase family 2 [Enterococcus gallinarum]
MAERINHPNPQFRRTNWTNLNGIWDFRFDENKEGVAQNWQKGFKSTQTIEVPFVYQSQRSGIHQKAFCPVVWYQRPLHKTKLANTKTIIHFEAVDYQATLWINGAYVGNHSGGNSRFSFDITSFLTDEENILVLRVEDSLEDMTIPRGKQYWKETAEVMWFTQMSGIWRDVWLEEKDCFSIEELRLTPNIDQKVVEIELYFSDEAAMLEGVILNTDVTLNEQMIAKETHCVKGRHLKFCIGIDDFNDHGLGSWWTPENPNLYDLKFELVCDDDSRDTVYSYFGMRKISIEQNKFCLNNRPYFFSSVLDQGYFPDTILTPPSFEALEADVQWIKKLGFNGVRKHMMSSENKFLYLCDYYGLLVWSEMAAAYDYSEEYAYRMVDEWKTVLKQGYNHPCIAAWVPLNESWGVPNIYHSTKQQAHAQSLYYLTKSVDDTRPVISNDGWEHCQSDLFTVHDYTSDEKILSQRYKAVETIISDMPGLDGRKFLFCPGYKYEGQPVMCTEMGGVNYRFNKGPKVEPSVSNEQEFIDAIKMLIKVYKESPIIEGFCYTQLTDTETEICGLLTWDREPKASVDELYPIFNQSK